MFDLPPSVIAEVRRLFGEANTEAVCTKLVSHEFPLISSGALFARTSIAIVWLSAGNPDRLDQEIERAKIDWRDTLMAAGLGDSDWRTVLETKGITNRDWVD